MSLSRRQVLYGGLSLLAGCAAPPTMSQRPGPNWPTPPSPPADPGRTPEPPAAASQTPTPPPPPPRPAPGPTHEVYARYRWTSHHARPGHVDPMGYISRITVHHEGWKPVYFTGWAQTVQRLRRIRRSHVNYHGWGDIGYHFVIDRAGRTWEARDLRYQGAHVEDHNAHNIGVMVLGNFEEQYPAKAQLDALVSFLNALMHQYHVPVNRVYTHRELGDTACPGRYLQPKMVRYRRDGRLT